MMMMMIDFAVFLIEVVEKICLVDVEISSISLSIFRVSYLSYVFLS